MNIKEIERAVTIVGGQSALARACGVSQPAVFSWLSGKSSPNPRFAIFIEKATNGAVRRIDLCPELFSSETETVDRRTTDRRAQPQPNPEA